ncbi:MAG: STAS domain-containing protein [Boseongicola sp.]|nr:STAS domain-containing protein [Boseongicola sp.]NNJ66873.1 STAS domain-containing protein [Boseongicola sp.]
MADIDILQPDESAAQIALPTRLDTASAPTVLAEIAAHRGRDICLDFANVTMLGTLCLQVLMNARHHWDLNGQKVTLANLSSAAEKALADFGTTPQNLTTGGAP